MDCTNILSQTLWVWGILMSLPFISSMRVVSDYDVNPPGEPTPREYPRFPEVKKQCSSFLSSGHILELDAKRANLLELELSFAMGDWIQASGDAPLMPFDASDAPANTSGLSDPFHLVTFRMDHVDPANNSYSSLNVSGSLAIGIFSRSNTYLGRGRHRKPEFRFRPGSSELNIVFEGVYAESKDENGEERVLCLLGDALLPSRTLNSTYNLRRVKDSSPNKYVHPLLQDDQILLVLRYPKSPTLTNRAVLGEMKSLNQLGSPRYFDNVQISSLLIRPTNYKFDSEELVSQACSPYPFQDDVVDDGELKVYRGDDICRTLYQLASREIFKIVPNWNCNSTDEYCSKLGPFAMGKGIKATHGGFRNVGLMMQDVMCEPRSGDDGVSLARVSAVFRVIHPLEGRYRLMGLHGLNNSLTLSAEGTWNSSVGQLCMVGCLGLADRRCDSRVCLYVPVSFSITRRSIIYGRLTSISGTHFPLSFESNMERRELWRNLDSNPFSPYQYSKINLAAAFLKRSKPMDFGTTIKKSLIRYPRKGDSNDEVLNLSQLSKDLTIHTPYVPDLVPDVDVRRSVLKMDILSIGLFQLGRLWNGSNETTSEVDRLLLNVSAVLMLTGELQSNISELNLEGLYNPVDGRMYLIGCRYVRVSWAILSQSRDLERGLDCSIEVKVEYPPKTTRWAMNPSAKFSITSQRKEDDPLHFSPVNLHTLLILYGQQDEYILSRRRANGILRVFTSSMAILCISSQLMYIRDNAEVAPYVSLVVLVVQASGYSVPLVTGAGEITAKSYGFPFPYWEKDQLLQITDYLVKVLLLGAFLLTLKIGQKVVKSRIKLLTRAPLEPRRVPSERRVLMITLGIHLIVFAGVSVLHFVNAAREHREAHLFLSGYSRKQLEMGVLLGYASFVQDFLLLPQIIGNLLWHPRCRPLKKTYYMGMTILRILPRVYDLVRGPDFNPYYSEVQEYVRARLGLYSRWEDVAIAVVVAALAAVICVQQRWSNHDRTSGALGSGHKGSVVPSGLGSNEMLPLISIQSELVSVVVGKEEG